MSFENSGQLDWVALSNTTIQTSLGVLNRLTQANVNQLTLELAKGYGNALSASIPASYLELIDKNIKVSKKYGFSLDKIWFGTGISAIPHYLATTRGGLAFAAVTMALTLGYTKEYTASVLGYLMEYKTASDIDIALPSHGQLFSVANELSTCRLDKTLTDIMWALENTCNTLETFKSKASIAPRAQDLARALDTLSSWRNQQDIVIRFSTKRTSDVVWIAAIAHRVFGFPVTLQWGKTVVWEVGQATTDPARPCRVYIYANQHGAYSTSSKTNNDMQIMSYGAVEIKINETEPRDLNPSINTTRRISLTNLVKRILDDSESTDGFRAIYKCVVFGAIHLSKLSGMIDGTRSLIPFDQAVEGLKTVGIPANIIRESIKEHEARDQDDDWHKNLNALLQLNADDERSELQEAFIKVQFGSLFANLYPSLTRFCDYKVNGNMFDHGHLHFGVPTRIYHSRIGGPVSDLLALWSILVFFKSHDEIDFDRFVIEDAFFNPMKEPFFYGLHKRTGLFMTADTYKIQYYRSFHKKYWKGPDGSIDTDPTHPGIINVKEGSFIWDIATLDKTYIVHFAFKLVGGHALGVRSKYGCLDPLKVFNEACRTELKNETEFITPHQHTLAITVSGKYLALSVLVDPDVSAKQPLSFLHGEGGVFVNNKAQAMILSDDTHHAQWFSKILFDESFDRPRFGELVRASTVSDFSHTSNISSGSQEIGTSGTDNEDTSEADEDPLEFSTFDEISIFESFKKDALISYVKLDAEDILVHTLDSSKVSKVTRKLLIKPSEQVAISHLNWEYTSRNFDQELFRFQISLHQHLPDQDLIQLCYPGAPYIERWDTLSNVFHMNEEGYIDSHNHICQKGDIMVYENESALFINIEAWLTEAGLRARERSMPVCIFTRGNPAAASLALCLRHLDTSVELSKDKVYDNPEDVFFSQCENPFILCDAKDLVKAIRHVPPKSILLLR